MIKTDLQEIIDENFSRYAGMVIQKRALVDVRDGLKPSARQLLYSQYIEKITHDKPFRKSTKSVAAGLNHFYTHGDTSAYSTLMRMGKPFATRYPLEEVQGSFGNLIKTGNEAAMRYTEMRLSPLAAQLFESIDKKTIDLWFDNYDDTEKFPSILPSIGFYNIVQGTQGIGVALASSIPQFNLKEVNNALIKLLWNEGLSFEDLYCQPDFATGGVIVNENEIKESLKTGNGKAIKLRGKIHYEAKAHQLFVTEFPYGVYSNTICGQLAELIEEDTTCGIDKFIDLTGESPLIKITLSKKANPDKVREWLFRNTSLQYHFGINMVMLEDGIAPKVFGWKEALLAYLNHSKIVLKKELEFDLKKAQNRLHIVDGFLEALSIIDEVVSTIRASDSGAAAVLALMNEFNFTELQAKAILDLKLQRLVNMEISKLEKEKANLLVKIDEFQHLLSNQESFYKVIQNRLEVVAKKFGDDRRTTVLNVSSVDSEEPIIEQNLVVTITKNGLIYPLETEQFVTQSRGGKGVKIKLANNDYIVKTLYGSSNDLAILFSTKGKAYTLKLSDLVPSQETYLASMFELEPNEEISAVVGYSQMNDYKYVIFATKKGYTKKSLLKEYLGKRKAGLQGIKLKTDDEVVSVSFVTDDSDNIVLTTRQGFISIIKQTDVPLSGRVTMGVIGVKLGVDDELVGISCYNEINKPKGLITVTKDGYTKYTGLEEFNVTNRPSKGVICQKFKTPNDYITAASILGSHSSEILGVASNSIIKVKVSELQKSRRDTVGSLLMKFGANSYIKDIVNLD